MKRRIAIRSSVSTGVFAVAGCLGKINTDGQKLADTRAPSATDPTTSDPTETETKTKTDFEGWVNKEELEAGYTVVYISADWEVVAADETGDWNPDDVYIGRRGFCKRYFVYEKIPDNYNIFFQGGCEDGVTVTVKDEKGRIIALIELPEKEISRD